MKTSHPQLLFQSSKEEQGTQCHEGPNWHNVCDCCFPVTHFKAETVKDASRVLEAALKSLRGVFIMLTDVLKLTAMPFHVFKK